MIGAAPEHPSDPPRVVLMFAGPNGSGKSTVTYEVLKDPEPPFDGPYINADDIAKTLPIRDDVERNVAAAVQAEALRKECMERGESFAFETVMSTPEKVAIITQARARGYEVNLVFVTTSNPSINVARVADRVAKKGHPVAESAIRSRYQVAMSLLPVAVELASSAVVFDNSITDRSASMVAWRFPPEALQIEDGAPAWVRDTLERPYAQRRDSLAALALAHHQDAPAGPPRCAIAEAAHGKNYTGRIVAASQFHVLQHIEDNRYLVHSRELTQPRTYERGATQTVSYAYDKGKIIQLPVEFDRGRDR